MGKWGFCGNIISEAFAGIEIEPLPNGQMPAIARNSVDLPAQTGPVTRMRSPLPRLKLLAETNGAPLGRRTRSSRRPISPPGDDNFPIELGLVASAAAPEIAVSNPSRRATTARHSAIVR